MEAVDARTIRIVTHQPTPLLLNFLSLVMIVPERNRTATTADYNSGRAMIGSGPYRFVSWQPGQPYVMERNPNFAGRAPDFPRVIFRPIENAGARVAALRAGDVDLIEIVPPEQMERFRTDPRFAVAESPSNRLIFLTLDSDRENSPHVRARDGGPIANPLRNRDVRRALSIAINREALVQRVLQGQGLPAGDLGPPGYFGTSPDLTPPPFDPEGARRLLAQAGYPQGFSLQINRPERPLRERRAGGAGDRADVDAHRPQCHGGDEDARCVAVGSRAASLFCQSRRLLAQPRGAGDAGDADPLLEPRTRLGPRQPGAVQQPRDRRPDPARPHHHGRRRTPPPDGKKPPAAPCADKVALIPLHFAGQHLGDAARHHL